MGSARFLFPLLLLSFTLKKTPNPLQLLSLSCRDNCTNSCFYSLALKPKYQFLVCLNYVVSGLLVLEMAFSPFSHPFTSVGNESGRCSPISPPNASAQVSRLAHSCRVPCWETQQLEYPSLALLLTLSMIISPSASPGRHLQFFQTASC